MLAVGTDDNGEKQKSYDTYGNALRGHFLRLRSRATLGGPLLDPDHFGCPVSWPGALKPIADAEIEERIGSV
eukprot:6382066-Pyramimonas_sp.AAC.1